MPKTRLPTLGHRLLDALNALRGSATYPPSLRALADTLSPPPDESAVLKAAKSKPFKDEAICAVPTVIDSPVALVGDLTALAESPLTLQAAFADRRKAGPSPWAPKDLAKSVSKPLKVPFTAALEGMIAAGTLPPFVKQVTVKKVAKLYHVNDPPPPPPPTIGERAIAELGRMTAAGQFPTLADLLNALTGQSPTPKVVKDLLGDASFKSGVVLARWKGDVLASPVALRTHAGELANSASLLDFVLAACERSDAAAFSVKTLADQIEVPKGAPPELRSSFTSVLESHTRDSLPPGVGYVEVGSVGKKPGPGQRHFFRLERVVAAGRKVATPEQEAVSTSLPAAFAEQFDAKFTQLDRVGGGNNFVSLIDLRAAFPDVPRTVFDAELLRFRRERRYSLKSAEGYDGLSPQEREAAIREEGEYLLHVSRIQP